MQNGAEIAELARRWIGTPYVHQASRNGAGADCLGLIRGVWRDLHGKEPEAIPPYSPDWGESRGEEVLLAAALRHFVPLSNGPDTDGMVLMFRMRDGAIAKHLGIVSAGGTAFVHAYSGHGVVESPLSAPWRRKIAARFAFPVRRS